MTIDSLLQDLRYASRTLRRDAGFTAFAILIVGLGIGASSTVFSVLNTLLLRPLPFQDPARLVWIANHDSAGLSGQTTQVNYLLDMRREARSFSALAAYFAFYGVGDNKLTGQGEPERLSGVPVSDNFFQVLGVEPQIGRLFSADECKWKGPRAVLLSHGFWERRFDADPAIVGRPLTLNDEPYTVIGVLPEWFDFAEVFAPGSHFDLYLPFPLTQETNRWGNTLAIVGRLAPGVTPAAAQAELTALAGRLSRDHPERNSFEGRLTPLARHVSGRIRPALLVLASAVLVVMLIVCANLSNLLLARTTTRQKEIAIRTALGAGRRRLIRQMLTESLLLSSSGAVLGVLLAVAGTRALSHVQSISIPLLPSVRTDGTALLFALAMAVVTGLVFGLVPALAVREGALHDALKDTGRGSTEGRGHQWSRHSLVVAEIAFACVLLVGAGLLIRSLARVLDVNMGFHPEFAAAMRVDPDPGYQTGDRILEYFDEVLRRAREVPGVAAAGLTDSLPLGMNRSWGTPAKGQFYPNGRFPSSYIRLVSDGYIRAMGIPLRAGRDFTERDRGSADPVIVVNETLARNLWPGESALGKIISACGERRVVGIVGDVRHLALEQESGNEAYLPMRQCRDIAGLNLVVRTARPPAELAGALRAALRPIAPELAGNDFRLIQQLVDKAVSPRRFVVLLLGGFALFALVLASLGIYAVISYSVSQRTQELGIRMALGASALDLESRILGRTLALAAAGMLCGMVASWMLSRAFSGLLFGVTATDPTTFLGMLAVLTAVSAAAGYLPARRAAHIDPMLALRSN